MARTTRDGFTGHEQLDHLGLVHMHGLRSDLRDWRGGRLLRSDDRSRRLAHGRRLPGCRLFIFHGGKLGPGFGHGLGRGSGAPIGPTAAPPATPPPATASPFAFATRGLGGRNVLCIYCHDNEHARYVDPTAAGEEVTPAAT